MNRTTFGTHDENKVGGSGDNDGVRSDSDDGTSNPYTSHGKGFSISPLAFSRRSPRLRALLDRILHKLISTPGQGLQSSHSKVACACVDLLSDSHVLQTLILYKLNAKSNSQLNSQLNARSNSQSNSQSNNPRNAQSNNPAMDTRSSNHEQSPVDLALAPMQWHHRWSDEWRQRLLQGSPCPLLSSPLITTIQELTTSYSHTFLIF